MIIYDPGEVYMEPFYPALYGAFNPRPMGTAIITNEARRTKTEQNVSDFDCWVPENAVYRIRKPSTHSYHSVGYYGNETIKLKPLPKRKGSIHSDKTSKSEEQDKTLVTNMRTASRRPTAVVHFEVQTRRHSASIPSQSKATTNSKTPQLQTTTEDTKRHDSCANPESSNPDSKPRESHSGKLLHGKIKAPFLARPGTDQEFAYDLVVYSSSYKPSHPHLIDLSQTSKSETNQSGKKKPRPNVNVYKQESIPSITSSRTLLPGLEVRPTSSIQNEAHCSSRGGSGSQKKFTTNVDRSSRQVSGRQTSSSSDKRTHQSKSENGFEQENTAGEIVRSHDQLTNANHKRTQKQRREILVPNPISTLNSVSSKLKPTNHKWLSPHSLLRIELDKETSSSLPPSTLRTSDTIVTSETANLSHSQSYKPATHQISRSRDQAVQEDSKNSRELHVPHDRKTKSSSSKSNHVVFRDNGTESNNIAIFPSGHGNKLNNDTHKSMRCELRSRQRRLRQHQMTLTGQGSGTSSNTANDISQENTRVCARITRPKVRVYIKGKSKPLVHFLPSVNLDHDTPKVSF